MANEDKAYYGAAVATQLNGGISSSTTAIVVDNGAGLVLDGTTGPFVLTIDRTTLAASEEKVLCTARAGNNLTVQRGYDNTPNVAHLDNASVEHVIDADSISQANRFANVMTTRGDMIRRGAADFERFALGATGRLLRSDGTDVVWADPPMIAPADIIECAATPVPVPNVVGITALSTFHDELMRWDGAQWRFASRRGETNNSLQGIPSGTTWLAIAPDAGHLFPIEFRNSAGTANNGGREYTSFTLPPMAGLRCRHNFRLPASIATRTIRMGFHDSTDHLDAVDGIYIEIANLTASFKTSQASTRTTHGTTVVLNTATWYVLHIVQLTTTTARAVIVSEAGTIVLDVTNSANVPGITQLFNLANNVTRSDAVAAANLMDTSNNPQYWFLPV